MKIIAFNSSPRCEKGNTSVMVEEFLKGAAEAGATTEQLFLARKNIKHCIGCFKCWTDTPGACVIKDDMTELLEKMKSADIAVFATPLYVDNVSGIMKNFMDRSIPLAEPFFGKDPSGECRHSKRFTKPDKFVVISNCGFPEQSHFQVLKLLFRRIARNFSAELLAEIYKGEGELLRNDSLLLKPFIWQYKRLLQRAGKEIASGQKLSDEVLKKLEEPLISEATYIKKANENFEKRLSKLESGV